MLAFAVRMGEVPPLEKAGLIHAEAFNTTGKHSPLDFAEAKSGGGGRAVAIARAGTKDRIFLTVLTVLSLYTEVVKTVRIIFYKYK